MYIVIAGGGKIAEYLGVKLLNRNHEVAIIEKNPETAQHLSDVLPGRQLVICGDGCDSTYQHDAGVEHADVFVATTGKDDDNLVSCEIASTVFNVPRTIARVNNPKNLRIFKAMGIEPVSSTTIISRIIEEETFSGDVATVSSLRRNNLAILEIEIPQNSRFFVHGKKLKGEIVLPAGSLIVATSVGNNFETVTPETVIHAGDTLIALVKIGDEGLVYKALHMKDPNEE